MAGMAGAFATLLVAIISFPLSLAMRDTFDADGVLDVAEKSNEGNTSTLLTSPKRGERQLKVRSVHVGGKNFVKKNRTVWISTSDHSEFRDVKKVSRGSNTIQLKDPLAFDYQKNDVVTAVHDGGRKYEKFAYVELQRSSGGPLSASVIESNGNIVRVQYWYLKEADGRTHTATTWLDSEATASRRSDMTITGVGVPSSEGIPEGGYKALEYVMYKESNETGWSPTIVESVMGDMIEVRGLFLGTEEQREQVRPAAKASVFRPQDKAGEYKAEDLVYHNTDPSRVSKVADNSEIYLATQKRESDPLSVEEQRKSIRTREEGVVDDEEPVKVEGPAAAN